MFGTAFAALLAALLGAAPTSCGDPAGELLRYRHSRGDKAVYQFDLSCRAEVKEEGGPRRIQAEMSVEMECLAHFLGETASRDWGIRGEISSGVIRFKGEGKDESLSFGEMSARYIVSPRGEVSSARLTSGDPPTLFFGGGTLAFGPEDAFLLGGAAIFPEKPIKKGDRWEGSARAPGLIKGEIQELPYESVLLGEENFGGTVCQKIKTTRRRELGGSERSPDGSGVAHIKLKISQTDTWLFDPERGVIMSIEGSARVLVTTEVEQGGQKLGGTATSGVINARSVLTEFNGKKITG